MSKNYIVASIGEWNRRAFEKYSSQLAGDWHFCSSHDELVRLLDECQPRYIFFPHWRWVVPKSIFDNFECVCFHMTDVPYGRGGSPLQNLILLGHKETMLTALRMEEELDVGPVYLKKNLSLCGSAYEIYQRAANLTWKLIPTIVRTEPIPTPQVGFPVSFNRRKPEESRIPHVLSLEQIYDYIRMLDAPGYPKAFFEVKNYHLLLCDAEFKDGELSAKVHIRKKES